MSTLKIVITIVFLVVSVAIAILILMQQGKDAGLGTLSGQSSETYWAKNKGRSKEGLLIKITTVLVVCFFVLAILLNIGSI